ncbi:MAG TPA: RT0821/Lpp0805 family surface protein [Methyloceanibacter sp.]|jgi:surface antigen|nr:RT0821/Lpp0805 family surface protein [Methyloceanibacter sp.]
MRTFRCNAPIIIGAGALAVLCFAPAPSLLKAEEYRAVSENRRTGPGDRSDRIAAHKALQLALSELGDGVTLVWQRPERGLVGRIRPVSAFRDDKGRVCRTVAYSLTLGTYQREIRGVACREQDGSWSLAG